MEFYLPNLMAKIVNNGIITGNQAYILSMGFRMLIVSILAGISMVIISYHSSRASIGFSKDIRQDIFGHITKFSIGEFHDLGTSSLITRTTNDVNQIEMVFLMFLRMMIRAPFMLVGGLIMAINKNAKLSLVLAVSMPILLAIIYIAGKKGIPMFKIVQEKIDGLNLVLREKLTGVRVIRAFSREDYEEVRFDNRNQELSGANLKVDRLIQSLFPIINLVLNFTIVGVLWFGSEQVDMGNMEVGDIMAFIQYVMMIMFSLIMFSAIFIIVPRAVASADRIVEIMDIDPTILVDNSGEEIEQIESIVFKDVGFKYPEAEEKVLSDLNFSVDKGQTLAIIGGTGSGKTTLINLIPRFYDITSGEILINGKELRKYNLKEIRGRIGFVPQKAVLFSGDIKSNLKVGKRDASLEEMERAVRISQAEEFINTLENKYDSLVAQGGKNFSGGQKQRLTIARALIRDSDVFIFDDSFSALDFKTDAKLRKALKEEVSDAIKIIVAQRVSSIMDADKILVLNKGKIAGLGRHKELMDSCEVYREIVESQAMEGE